MNNAENFPVDVEAEKAWLAALKETQGYSWAKVATETGIAQGTISTFMTGNYAGSKENVAVPLENSRHEPSLGHRRFCVISRESEPRSPARLIHDTVSDTGTWM